MTVLAPLQRLHAWATTRASLRVFTIFVRVLLALAFLPSGLVKIRGEPFTTLPVSDPVGYFFAGFFSAHGYYRFVGVGQWLAAALLLVPWTATIGALVYLPIVVNIFVITVAVDFQGTQVVTGLMLLANLWLLFWDFDRLCALAGFPAPPAEARARHGDLITSVAMFGAAAIGFFGVTGVHVGRLRGTIGARPLVMVVIGAALGLASVVKAWRSAARVVS